jgi:UDP-N-acetyl-D-galactosamine dehydrogenase
MSLPALADVRIGVIGLGYVGLPLAVYLARHFPVLGFDIDKERVADLGQGIDRTNEVTKDEFAQAAQLAYSADVASLKRANFYIVTVPTPVDQAKRPDLSALIAASHVVGTVLSPGDVVVYESTVFPGATEEVCVPELEKASGLAFNRDFFAGYSPERINPGDKTHRLPDIVKVTSGSTREAADLVDQVYATVITAGTHRASSIRVAEAAKVIENTQRDLNIALMNELAIIFQRMGIDTAEVLRAAETKWNFVRFQPGLVGGHCIGVDPYYLTHKAETLGYHPQVILAGRRINDGMAHFVAEMAVKRLAQQGFPARGSRAIVAGLAFKEDCPDLRNSKVADLVAALASYGLEVHVHDPLVDAEEAREEYGIRLESWDELPRSELFVLAVPHRTLVSRSLTEYAAKSVRGAVLVDIRSRLDARAAAAEGFSVWRL